MNLFMFLFYASLLRGSEGDQDNDTSSDDSRQDLNELPIDALNDTENNFLNLFASRALPRWRALATGDRTSPYWPQLCLKFSNKPLMHEQETKCISDLLAFGLQTYYSVVLCVIENSSKYYVDLLKCECWYETKRGTLIAKHAKEKFFLMEHPNGGYFRFKLKNPENGHCRDLIIKNFIP